MTSQTRYMRNDEVLGTTDTDPVDELGFDTGLIDYYGIQVWIKHADNSRTWVPGSATEGWTTAVAPFAAGAASTTTINAGFTVVANHAIVAGDEIQVEVYQSTSTPPTAKIATFTTSGFSAIASQLDAGNWTVYYRVRRTVKVGSTSRFYFRYGGASDESYITTFQFTASYTAHTGTFIEVFGALDSKTRSKTTHRTLTELFGALDARSRAKSIHRTLIELFGGLDAKTRVKSIHRTFTELLGGLDSRTRVKSIYREITEKLGLSDLFSKTTGAPVPVKQWGYSVPFSIFRKIGLSGTVIRPQRESLGLRAGLLDRKSLSRRVHGKAVVPVSQPIKINISSLLRRKSVGVHGISVVHVGKRSTMHGRLLRPTESSVRVVGEQRFDLVAEVLGLLEATATFMFVAVVDDKTCTQCMQHNMKVYTQDDIARLFPYAQTVDWSLIMPMVHPSCRCLCVLLEIGA